MNHKNDNKMDHRESSSQISKGEKKEKNTKDKNDMPLKDTSIKEQETAHKIPFNRMSWCFGICMGILFGIIYENLLIGLCLGFVFGKTADSLSKKKGEKTNKDK